MSPRPSGELGDLEPTDAESRRSARERALELLYEAESKGVPVADVLGGLPLAPDPLAVELATGVDAHRERIDEVLSRLVAPKWTLARLASVDRAVLRMAAYELFEAPDRSQALIINEAVLLARRFGTDDSPRFVNGVLSAVAAEARPADGDASTEP
jgi:N utilization substance protein B